MKVVIVPVNWRRIMSMAAGFGGLLIGTLIGWAVTRDQRTIFTVIGIIGGAMIVAITEFIYSVQVHPLGEKSDDKQNL